MYLNNLDETRNVYCCPIATLSNEKKPNELVVAVRTALFASVIVTIVFRSPLPSDVNTRPETVAVVDGVGVGVGETVGVGVGVAEGVGVGVGVAAVTLTVTVAVFEFLSPSFATNVNESGPA